MPLPGAVQGILDTTPIDGAGHTVTLIDTNGTKLSVVSEADGVFTFPEVTPGLYAIDVRIEGFAPMVVPNVRVKAGQTLDVGVLELLFLQTEERATGELRGKVESELGPAVQGATVEFFLASSTTALASAVTDADGFFRVRVAPGAWRMVAHHPWYESEELVPTQPVVNGEMLDLRLTPIQLKIVPATVTGTVLLERDGDDPIPAAGASVDLEGGLAQATVDAQGHFSMIQVVAGSHQLTVTGIANYADPQPGRTFTAIPGETLDIGTITLAMARATVRGTVETADGSPADGISVTLEPIGYGTTAAAGQVNYLAGYRITQVPYGNYTVVLSKQGYFRATRPLVVDKPNIEVCPTTPPVPNNCTQHVVLAPQSGDFILDDLDDTNRPGFTRSNDVVVVFTSAGNAAEMRVSEDSTFAGASFVPYANNAHFLLTTTEGVKTVYVQLKDSTGLVGATLRASIELDATPPPAPMVTLDSTGLGVNDVKFTSTTNSLPVRVVSTDSQSGIYYMRLSDDPTLDANGLLQVANLPYQSNTSFGRSTTADGVQHVYAQVIDYAGNASSLGDDVVIVDNTDPQGTGLLVARGPAATEDGYTNQPLVVLSPSADAEPDGGRVEVRFSNVQAVLSQTTYQSVLPTISWLLDTSTDGTKTIYAQFRDTAGNDDRFAQATIIYDSAPPSPVSASIGVTATGDAGVTVNVATSATDLSATEAITVSESPGFTDVSTWGPAQMPVGGNVPFVLQRTDGVHTVYVRFKDKAGNVSIATTQVTFDGAPPAPPVFALTATGTNGTTKFTRFNNGLSLPFTMSGIDALSGVAQMRVSTSSAVDASGRLTSGTSFSYATSGALTWSGAQGPVTVYAQLIDAAGNVSGLSSDTIVVDTVAPSGGITIAPGAQASAGFTNSGTVNVSVTSPTEPNGGAVSFKMANDNGTGLTQAGFQDFTPTVTWFLDTSSEGSKTVYAQFRDSAGNTSSATSASITYDVTAPGGTLTAPSSSRTRPLSLTVASSATDLAAAPLTLSENSTFAGATPQALASPAAFTLANTGDGPRTVYARFRDRAGNDTIVSAQVTLDASPPPAPTFALTATGTNGTTKFTRFGTALAFTISGVDTGSGVTQMRLSNSSAVDANGVLSSGATSAYGTSGSFTYAGTQGPVTVYAQLLDAAGNASPLASDTIVVDSLVPTGTVTIARGAQATTNGFTNSGTVNIGLSAAAEPNGGALQFKMANDNGAGLSAAGYQDLTGTVAWFLDTGSEGLKTVYVSFRDSAGNETASPVSGTITYDVTPPNGTLSAPSSTRTRPLSLTVSSSATDLSATPLTLSEFSTFSGATAQALSSPVAFTLANTGDGPRTVYARFRDRAGNDSIVSAQVTLDSTPPAAPVFSLNDTGTNGATKFTRFGTSLVFSISGVDSLSGVTQMRLSTSSAVDANGVLSTGTTSAYALSGNFAYAGTQGPVTVYAQLLDAAGNASALRSDTIVVDSLAPTGTVTIARGAQAPVNGYTNSATVSVQLSAAAEPNGGALQFKMANDNGSGLAGAGYQDLTAALSWVIDGSTEGLKTVYVLFRDSAGNETASPVSGSITYDVTPPTPVSASVTPQPTRTLNVAVLASTSATDLVPDAGMTISESSGFIGAGTVGPGAVLPSTPFVLSAGTDGLRTVYTRFRDRAGNDTIVSSSVTLDRAAPAAPVFSLTATGTNNGLKFTRANAGLSLPFTISGSDSETSVAQMRLSTSSAVDANGVLTSGTTVPYATAGSYTWNNTQGAVTVYAQLIDAAGNASALASDTVVVDTVVPTGGVTIARGAQATTNGFTNSTTVSVSLSASAEPAGGALQFKIANDNGAGLASAGYQDLTSSLSWLLDGSTDGLKTVYVMLRDSAGNETASPVSGAITYDSTAPSPASASITPSTTRVSGITVTVSSSAGDLSATEALTLSESTSFSGAGTVGPMAMPGGGTQAFTLSSGGDGLRTVYVRFKDRAGNTTVVPATVTIDTTAPTGSLSVTGTLGDGATQSNVATATTSVRVTFNVTGAVEYVLGDASLSTCPGAGYTAMPAVGYVDTTLAAGADGARQVRGCFRDAAGNIFGALSGPTWVPSASITYDTAAPSGCTVTLAGKSKTGAASPVAGKTALTNINVTTTGCAGVPTQLAIVSGSVTCSATPSLPWQGYTNGLVPFTLSNQEGSQQVTVCVRDAALNAGNAMVSAPSITLDTQPPTGPSLTISSPQDNGYTNTQNASVSGSADDAQRWAVAAASTGPFTFNPYSSTPSVTSFNFGSDGRKVLYAVFVDDVGNQTLPVSANIVVDSAAPAAPRFYSLDMANRGARLFWDSVSDPAGILRYELWCGPSTPSAKCGEVDGTKTDGWVLNLTNRKNQVFAVRAIDNATNASPLSASLAGVVGFKRLAVPINSSYSIAPLDIATSGNDIYVTFSERDANWQLRSGNLKIAVSNDRGVTWRVSTLDAAFGANREVGHIGITDRAVVVGTVGSASPPDDDDQGEVKVLSSIDQGATWSQLIDTSPDLRTSTNFGSPSGLGLVASGDRLAAVYRQWDSAALRLAWSSTGGTPSSINLNSGALYTPSAQVTGLKSCAGNYSAVHAWRRSNALDVLTQYFINFNTAVTTTGGDSQLQSSVVTGTAGATTDFTSFDLACVSLPEATQIYVVYQSNTVSTGSARYINLRRKLTASSSFTTAFTLANDADSTETPKVWAGGRNVFVLYRNSAGLLTMLESNTEGGSFAAPMYVESNPNNGYSAVMSGDNTQDVAVAYTDNTGSTLTVMVPSLPAVRSQLTAGIGLSRLTWSPVSGVDRYQIASGTGSSFTDFNYSGAVSYDVPPSSPTALTSFSIRAVDTNNMAGNDGFVWQTEPAVVTVALSTDGGAGGPESHAAGIVAYNQSAVMLPPFGMKAPGTNDLTLYRTQNGGQTWTSSGTAYSGNPTSAARALAGFGGRATVFSKLASFNGVYATNLLLAGGNGASFLVDGSGGAFEGTFVAAKADVVSSRIMVAYSDVETGTIKTSMGVGEADGGITYTAQSTFTIQTPASYTLNSLDIAKFDGNRAVITWRQTLNSGAYEAVYMADTLNATSDSPTWNVPVFVRGGYWDIGGTDAVANDAYAVGSGNSAYTVVAYSSMENPINQHSANLYVGVTGTDVASNGVTTLAIDHDKVSGRSISAFANGDGQYLSYIGEDPISNQNRLKLAYCPVDCHLLNSWRRSILATGGSRYAPTFSVAQTTGGNAPVYYLPYIQYVTGSVYELRVLRGGVHKLTR